MPQAYIVVEMNITDMEQYKKYMAEAPAVVAQYGGEYLVRGGRHDVFEGNWKPARLAVLRFPSMEQARAFYDSKDYQAVRAKRLGATEFFDMVCVEGT
jgi:uncharacterized protein (DUF1330 family)